MTFSVDDTYELEGSTARVVKRDFDKAMEAFWNKMSKEEPWEKMPDPKCDLGWHIPSCTLEAWRHTDVKCELGEGIVYFILNRAADSNKLNGSMIAALTDAIFLLHSRRDLRVAVFTGEGTMFCAGGEPKADGGGAFEQTVTAEVHSVRQALAEKALKAGAFPDGQVSMGRLLQTKLWHAWATVPQFTICLANGSAMGDGIGLITCCDYAIGLSNAFFSLSDVKIGLVPAAITPYIVAKTGNGIAKRIFCTSENMSGARAVENGILDETVDSIADGHKMVGRMCEQLTACGPRTVEAAKELVFGVAGQQIIEPLFFYTSMMGIKVACSEEAQAARAAVGAGRPKPWEATAIKPLR